MTLEMKVRVHEPFKIKGVLPWLLNEDRSVKMTAQGLGEPLGVLFLDMDGPMDPHMLMDVVLETPRTKTPDWYGYFYVMSSRGHYHFIVLAPYTWREMVNIWASVHWFLFPGTQRRDFHRWVGKSLITGQPVLRVGPKGPGEGKPGLIQWRHLRIPKGSSVWSWATGYQHYLAQRYGKGITEGLCPLITYPNRKGTFEFQDMKEVDE